MNYFEQKTERLYFRKLTVEDIPKWRPFFDNNESLPYLGIDLSKSFDVIAREWIEIQFPRYEETGIGHLAIIEKATNTFIGVGGLLPRELRNQPEYEIAYSLLPQYRGKGYATEIAKQLRLFGEENIQSKRFISIIHIDNKPSARVAVRNGMHIAEKTEFAGMPVEIYSTAP
jgi:RimJ/RimL family protein N-acetyltransferase